MRQRFRRPRITVSPFAFPAAALIAVDGSIYALLAFVAALLHEAGHLAAAYILRVPVTEIAVCPLGAVITLSPGGSYRAELIVKLAGGAVNALAALCGGIIIRYLPPDCGAVLPLRFFILCCAALAIFNLLPIRRLDGGEALYSALCLFLTPEAAGNAVGITSLLALIPLWTAAAYMLFYYGSGLSALLLAVWLASAGLDDI